MKKVYKIEKWKDGVIVPDYPGSDVSRHIYDGEDTWCGVIEGMTDKTANELIEALNRSFTQYTNHGEASCDPVDVVVIHLL